MLLAAFVLGLVLALVWVCVRREYDGIWLLGVLAAVALIVVPFFAQGAKR
jgi:hypothetical protein